MSAPELPKPAPKPEPTVIKQPQQPQLKQEPTPSLTYKITFYTAYEESTGKNPGDSAFGITASGERVNAGITAACPPEIPLGTPINIQGLGTRICQDRGGAIKGQHIDVYVQSVEQARSLGVQYREVQIVE